MIFFKRQLTAIVVVICLLMVSPVNAILTEVLPGTHYLIEEAHGSEEGAFAACYALAESHNYPHRYCFKISANETAPFEATHLVNAGWLWNWYRYSKTPFEFGRFYFNISCPEGQLLNNDNGCIPECEADEVYDPSSNSCTINPKNCPSGGKDGFDGNPIAVASGNKYQSEIDYGASISQQLSFRRHYSSAYSFNKNADLGNNWRHNYSQKLDVSLRFKRITARRANGQLFTFTRQDNAWVSDPDLQFQLTEINEPDGQPIGWILHTPADVQEHYDQLGRLTTIYERTGKTTQYTYNTEHLLEQVTGHYGRTLSFSYDTLGRLVTLTTPDNTQLHYVYDDTHNHLISVVYPDNTPSDLSDNPSKTYHYEDVNFPHHLTGITDENNVHYATWAYNNDGLAILSEHANSAEKVELLYNIDKSTTVTDALGRVKIYTFETHYGVSKPKTIQYQYHDGKQLVTKIKIYHYYPENGWVKEIIDYSGNITYFEYNDRGLITLETRAQGTPDEYAIVTTWHPDYQLPATRTYPNKTVSYDYDDKGQLTATHTTANP